VTVARGRRLNLFCIGHGEPTVVFESGLGDDSLVWRFVQGQIGATTRACSYDRAGYGFSDPSGRAADAANTVSDLHALLLAAGIVHPIVLVGHSIGGLYATLYAQRDLSRVAGLVLVDPSFAYQRRALVARLAPAPRTRMLALFDREAIDVQACLDLARRGALVHPANAQAARCLTSGPGSGLDPTLLREVHREAAMPAVLATVLSELRSFSGTDVDSGEVAASRRSFGSLPLAVLTATKSLANVPGLSAADLASVVAAWVAGHDRLARRSTRGTNTLVPNSGHYIELEQPAIVVAAIRRIIAEARTSR